MDCALGGDGYGPSDHMPFYAAGVPVLHFFTGAHSDYHKPSDAADRINAAGLAKIGAVAADIALKVAKRPEVSPIAKSKHPRPRATCGACGRLWEPFPTTEGLRRVRRGC